MKDLIVDCLARHGWKKDRILNFLGIRFTRLVTRRDTYMEKRFMRLTRAQIRLESHVCKTALCG